MSSKYSSMSLLYNAFILLTYRERIYALILVFALALSGFLDAVALSSIAPIAAIIIEPDLLSKYEFVNIVRNSFQLSTDQGIVSFLAIGSSFLLILSFCFSTALLFATNRFGSLIQTRMAYDLMNLALKAPYKWHINQNIATLVRFFHNDIVRWGRDFVQRNITLAQHLIGAFVPVIILLYASPSFAYISIPVIFCAGLLLTFFVQPSLKRASRESKSSVDKFIVLANNSLSSVKDIRITCTEDYFCDQFSRVFAHGARASASLNSLQGLPGSLLLLTGQLTLLLFSLSLWIRGVSKAEIAGQIALIVLATARIIPSANRFFGLYSSMSNITPWVSDLIEQKKELSRLCSLENDNSDIIVPKIGSL